MAKQRLVGFAIFLFGVLFFQAVALTHDEEVEAVRDLYRALNSPAQLKNWKLEGSDPCGESWTGLSCHQSSVIEINLQELSLTVNLGDQLLSLQHLKHLDLSSNQFHGVIPNSLPHNLTDLNLAVNNFSQSISHTLSSMKHLRHLNLSQNLLSGPLPDVFGGLENLVMMDLSHNNFNGGLPTSFRILMNLIRLNLQSNEFTGSVIFLADLHLHDLSIEDNHLGDVITENFQNINSAWIGGNPFCTGVNYPLWKFASDLMPNEQYPSHEAGDNVTKIPGTGGIVIMVLGAVMTVIGAAVFIAVRTHQSRKQTLDRVGGSLSSLQFPPNSASQGALVAEYNRPDCSSSDSPPLISSWQLPPAPAMTLKMSNRRNISRKCKIPICAKLCTVAELQLATGNFNPFNLLGEGTLGSVYRADFPDGQILAVKNIKTVALSITEEEQFMEVIRTVSHLRHPNIVSLIDYSLGNGNHLLLYEYIRKVTLDDALQNVLCGPLTWSLRLRIAIGVSRALNYLHTSCVPSILLVEDLNPHICDCGLAVLKTLASNSVKIKSSEIAIADSGYIAPEHVKHGSCNPKADIYSFGVLLLELLTGRRPFDSSKPKGEQSLVEWASSRHHDNEDICHLVKATIGYVIPKILGLFALGAEITISWEMIKRKFILPSTILKNELRCEMLLPLPEYGYPSLTPLLLLYHTDYGNCEVYDPMISDGQTKKVKGLNLKGFELIGSSLNGWLLLLSHAECRFCLYDLSAKQWLKLLESKFLGSEKHFIGVTDGLSNIMLLESQHNGELLTLPFEILEDQRVVEYPGGHYRLKGKITNAMLGGNGDVLCFIMKQDCLFQAARIDRVRGSITLRQSDLNRYFCIPESDFTCLVPSLWGSLLIVCFKGINCYVHEALHRAKVVLKVSSILCYQLNHITLYVAPDGAGTLLFTRPDEEGGNIYLSTIGNSDCRLLGFADDTTAEVNSIVKKICDKQRADKCSCQSCWLMLESEPSQE